MWARNLCGDHIGQHIMWAKLVPTHTGGFAPEWRMTDTVTMILHKKNGRVLVRHGTNNRQLELSPDTPIGEVSNA